MTVVADCNKDAGVRNLIGRIAGVLDRSPGMLEQQPRLGVHELRIARGHPKERRIEAITPSDTRPHGYVPRITGDSLRHAPFARSLRRENFDALHALAQVLPELAMIRGSRKLAGDSHYREAVAILINIRAYGIS